MQRGKERKQEQPIQQWLGHADPLVDLRIEVLLPRIQRCVLLGTLRPLPWPIVNIKGRTEGLKI